jgi:hypothetical protein
MSIDVVLEGLQNRVAPLEWLIEEFATSLGDPILAGSDGNRAYRYQTPDVRHFCLLKGVRVASALNAMIALARMGYTQELYVLTRTVVEFTSDIEFVLEDGPPDHTAAVEKYVREFFEDAHRGLNAVVLKAEVRRGIVHAKLGETLDEIAKQIGATEVRQPAAKLYTGMYRTYSNYVHGKYPETMDLYGGIPGRFHLTGMAGTRKDSENLAQLDNLIEMASNAFVIMISDLLSANSSRGMATLRIGTGAEFVGLSSDSEYSSVSMQGLPVEYVVDRLIYQVALTGLPRSLKYACGISR